MAPERLDHLVLARLCFGKTNLRDARDTLARLVENSLSPAAWRQAFDGALERLLARGWVEPEGKPTAEGRRALAAHLGLDTLPPLRNWDAAVGQLLVPRALGLAPEAKVRQRLRDPDRLRGAALAGAQRLELEAPTLRRTVDALAWRELGVVSDAPLTVAAIRRLMLHRALGTPERYDWKTQAAIGAAAAVGAPGREARALRRALVTRWLGSDDGGVRGEQAPAAPSLATFAGEALRAARAPSVARFGADRAFIASVHEAAASALPLEQYKERLVEAHRQGLLELARADLVAAMDPDLVARSETSYLHSRFHFVVTPGEGPA